MIHSFLKALGEGGCGAQPLEDHGVAVARPRQGERADPVGGLGDRRERLLDRLQRLRLGLGQDALDRAAVRARVAVARRHLAIGHHDGAEADRPVPPALDQRDVLERQDDGRHVVEGVEHRRAQVVAPVLAARMHCLPLGLQESRNGHEHLPEPAQVAVEHRQPREQRQEPQVARPVEQGEEPLRLAPEIDRGAVEDLLVALVVPAEEGRGKLGLDMREAVEEVEVGRLVEILAAGQVRAERLDQSGRVEIERHGARRPSRSSGASRPAGSGWRAGPEPAASACRSPSPRSAHPRRRASSGNRPRSAPAASRDRG
ncbi:hypothetical protein MET9862_05648 [Methylobacterium symbioticum]|uniref:Uncharacterized protein n=1 Tax=Methylobacterium symbioticum TaxID=2584084 RepID=A0A509ELJ7_9HYPH|nr:hypothetical protein MET9862_05648 [Methylobacterium symbioticum]